MEEANNLQDDHGDEPVSEAPPPGGDLSADQIFRADLNHQLRTPLNAIIGFAELLAMKSSAHRNDADVQQILKSARELLVIIERELTDPAERKRAAAGGRMRRDSCDVLYVEDDIVNFTLVERILEFRPGLRVVHASNGQTGLEMADNLQPSMILLDLNLPDMHGSEVLHRLQKSAATASVPVVILSANATPSQIERLLTAGAKNYLTKPFDIDPFLAVVDEMLQFSRERTDHKLVVLDTPDEVA